MTQSTEERIEIPSRLRDIAQIPVHSFEVLFQAADEIELLRSQHKALGQISVEQVLRAERAEATLRKLIALCDAALREYPDDNTALRVRAVLNEGRP